MSTKLQCFVGKVCSFTLSVLLGHGKDIHLSNVENCSHPATLNHDGYSLFRTGSCVMDGRGNRLSLEKEGGGGGGGGWLLDAWAMMLRF